MIFTDYKYVFSDNPENDYQELRDFYKKHFKRYTPNFYRHDGVLYGYAKKSIKKALHQEKYVLIVGQVELWRRIKGKQHGIDDFKIDINPLRASNYIMTALGKILEQHKLERTIAMMSIRYKNQFVLAERKNLKGGIDAYFEVSQQHQKGRCWFEKEGELFKEIDIPKEIVEKIEQKLRYLPKERIKINR